MSTAAFDNETCECGHSAGEHDVAGECVVEGCDCVYFEESDLEDDEDDEP